MHVVKNEHKLGNTTTSVMTIHAYEAIDWINQNIVMRHTGGDAYCPYYKRLGQGQDSTNGKPIDDPDVKPLLEEGKPVTKDTGTGKWFGMPKRAGNMSANEFIGTLREWPEGREIIKQYEARIARIKQPRSIKLRKRFADSGELRLERYYAGREDCCTRLRRDGNAQAGQQFKRLTFDIGGSWTKSAEQLSWTGLVATVLSHAMERAGYQIEIFAHFCGTSIWQGRGDKPSAGMIKINIKRHNEFLDIDRLLMIGAATVFTRGALLPLLGHPSFSHNQTVLSGYGYPADTPEDAKGDMHVGHIYSREAAESELDRLLKEVEAGRQ